MFGRNCCGALIAALVLFGAAHVRAATCPVTVIPLQYNSGGSTVNLDVVDDGTGSGNCRLSGDIGSIAGTTAAVDPCQIQPKTPVTVRLTGAGTQVIAGVATKNTYLCQVSFPPQAATVDMSIVEGTGTNCATINRALFGGTTPATGAVVSTSGGWEQGDGLAAVMWTTTQDDEVCITTNAALSGSLVIQQR